MQTHTTKRLLGWLAPAVLATSLGLAAMAPAPAHAQDGLARVLVDVADVVFNNGTPYYRYGDQGNSAPLIVGRDAYGRPVYYRQAGYGGNGYDSNPYQRTAYDRYGRPVLDEYGRRIDYRRYASNDNRYPPYGNANGHDRNDYRAAQCNRHGKCKGWRSDHDDHGDRDHGWNEQRRHEDDDD